MISSLKSEIEPKISKHLLTSYLVTTDLILVVLKLIFDGGSYLKPLK